MQYNITHANPRMQLKLQCLPEIFDSVTTKLSKVNLSELYQMVRPQCRPLYVNPAAMA